MQLQLIILSDLGFHAHLQLQGHDREQHTEGPLGLQQCARPALGAWKQSLQIARKEILRLRNINCTGPEQVCLEDFPRRFSERSPDQQLWPQVGICDRQATPQPSE